MTKRASHFSNLLSDWVQVFAAGRQVDSNGNAKEWTEADLDEMVANFDANDAFPMVVGHPKHDSPAFGWGSGLKREGKALFAKFEKVAEQFIAWGQAGHIRNRSVKIVKTPKGYRVAHIGFLGAMPPAVEGMPSIEFAADAVGETYEFGWSEAFETTLIARILRRLREGWIGQHGQEKADALISPYELEELESVAANKRASNQTSNPTFSQHTESIVSAITQEQLDKAVADARKEEQAKHATATRAAQFTANLAANRSFISSLIGNDKGQVRLTPAQAEGWAEALTFAQGLESAEFTFSAADQSEHKPKLHEFLKGKLEQLVPQLKLGAEQADTDPAEGAHTFSAPSDVAVDKDRLALHGKAKEYQAKNPGTTYIEAVRAVGG